MENASPPPRAQPKSLSDLFFSFTFLALQGFGGVLAIVQRELVERRRWVTQEEFIEDWAVAQIMPGPNVVNICVMIGGRAFGFPGALTAVAGLIVFPLVVVLLLAALFSQFAGHPGVAGALRGMGAIVSGLIAATGIKLLGSLREHPLGLSVSLAVAAIAFVAIALLRIQLVYVLLGLGGLSCVLTYRKLQP
jgi:chromate transporter